MLSPGAIASLWKGTGGSNCAIAVAVCLAESSGNTMPVTILQRTFVD